MARFPQRLGLLLIAYLALVGYALVAWLPQIVDLYQRLAEKNPRLSILYLCLVSLGGLILVGLSLWLMVRLWRNTVGKQRRRDRRMQDPSQMSAAEKESELSENIRSSREFADDEHVSAELRKEIQQNLEELHAKQAGSRLEIVAFGTISSGKSSLLNALAAVRQTITRFADCSDEERQTLQHDLDELQRMAEKLESGRVEIVVFGEISTGKSALVNALVGDDLAQVNVQGGWTKDLWHVPWEGVGYCVPGFAHSQVVLVDTPGLNEVAGADRAEMARSAAAKADLVLFVTDSDLNESEYSALEDLAAANKPLLLVLNKTDLYRPEERDQLLSLFRGPRLAGIIDPENVVTTQADPREVEYVIESSDGISRSEWRKPSPQVEELRLHILEVLKEEGKSLIALNAAMFAADKSDRMAALRVRLREDRANKTIWTYAVSKSLAVALNPIPAVDVLGGTAVDAAMVVTLGRIYGIDITTSNARSLVTSIAQAAGWVWLSEAAVSYASSIFKALTVGYGSVVTYLPQGAAAGYGSYIVGQSARYYFQHGASWGEHSPKQVVTQILDNTDKESVLQQLKEQIKKKISLNPYVGEG
jgi:small GTP-binding protein